LQLRESDPELYAIFILKQYHEFCRKWNR
jgi:hypothetical protein